MAIWGMVESVAIQKVIDGIENMAKGYAAAYGRLPPTVSVQDLVGAALVRIIVYSPDLILLPHWDYLRIAAWREFGSVLRKAQRHRSIPVGVSDITKDIAAQERAAQRLQQLRHGIRVLLPLVDDAAVRVLLEVLQNPTAFSEWESVMGYKRSKITTARVRAYVGVRQSVWSSAVEFLRAAL